MRIIQITSKIVFGEKYVGWWYCSESALGTDKEYVHRYLQHDGTWGKTTQYFDTKEEIDQALSKGHKPNFGMDRQELQDRQSIRDDMEKMFDLDARDDDYDY